MKLRTRFFCITILFFSIFSCDRPNCTNNNSVFDKFTPNQKEYKDELVKQLNLSDKKNLRYWLKEYKEQDGQEYLYFYVQGDNLCAVIAVSMTQWSGLENLREKKGVSYRGAEFTKLRFDIQQDDSSTKFIYQSYKQIID